MSRQRAENILRVLRQTVTMPNWTPPKQNPFENLIATIISQNTNDKNTERAFENLSKHFEITPQTLSKAEISKLEECLRSGGLYKRKAKTIQTVSKIILEKFGGSLTPILSLSSDESRKMLLELPGVGPKTADVLLLFCANQATIPVDTHVNRVAKRLGLTPINGGYEIVRLGLQSIFEPKDYLEVHLLFIALGRKYCKAGHLQCDQCPVNIYCPSMNKEDEK